MIIEERHIGYNKIGKIVKMGEIRKIGDAGKGGRWKRAEVNRQVYLGILALVLLGVLFGYMFYEGKFQKLFANLIPGFNDTAQKGYGEDVRYIRYDIPNDKVELFYGGKWAEMLQPLPVADKVYGASSTRGAFRAFYFNTRSSNLNAVSTSYKIMGMVEMPEDFGFFRYYVKKDKGLLQTATVNSLLFLWAQSKETGDYQWFVSSGLAPKVGTSPTQNQPIEDVTGESRWSHRLPNIPTEINLYSRTLKSTGEPDIYAKIKSKYTNWYPGFPKWSLNLPITKPGDMVMAVEDAQNSKIMNYLIVMSWDNRFFAEWADANTHLFTGDMKEEWLDGAIGKHLNLPAVKSAALIWRNEVLKKPMDFYYEIKDSRAGGTQTYCVDHTNNQYIVIDLAEPVAKDKNCGEYVITA